MLQPRIKIETQIALGLLSALTTGLAIALLPFLFKESDPTKCFEQACGSSLGMKILTAVALMVAGLHILTTIFIFTNRVTAVQFVRWVNVAWFGLTGWLIYGIAQGEIMGEWFINLYPFFTLAISGYLYRLHKRIGKQANPI